MIIIRRLLRWPFFQLALLCFKLSGRFNRVAQRIHHVPFVTEPPAPIPPPEPAVDVQAALAEMRRLRALAAGGGTWALGNDWVRTPPAPPEAN